MNTVLVTGASRGIGKAVAEKFLEMDWQVIGTSTSGKSDLKYPNLQMFELDLSDAESINRFVDQLKDQHLKIDILVNNAAVHLDMGEEVEVDILKKTLDVNLVGTVDLTEKVLPLIKSDGHIVNVSSGSSSLTDYYSSYAPTYKISKTALNMYTKVLSTRLLDKRITVSAFNPGWVRTDMGGKNAPKNPEDAAEELYELVTSEVETGNFWVEGRKQPW